MSSVKLRISASQETMPAEWKDETRKQYFQSTHPAIILSPKKLES